MLQFFNFKNIEEVQELMEENSNTKDTELGKIFEDKFISQERFSIEIEKIVIEQNSNYIDAIITYCEVNNIDVESVPKLISKPLKEKIKYEATELNFLKKTSRARLVF